MKRNLTITGILVASAFAAGHAIRHRLSLDEVVKRFKEAASADTSAQSSMLAAEGALDSSQKMNSAAAAAIGDYIRVNEPTDTAKNVRLRILKIKADRRAHDDFDAVNQIQLCLKSGHIDEKYSVADQRSMRAVVMAEAGSLGYDPVHPESFGIHTADATNRLITLDSRGSFHISTKRETDEFKMAKIDWINKGIKIDKTDLDDIREKINRGSLGGGISSGTLGSGGIGSIGGTGRPPR
jgi:hypothetical protein